MRNWKFNHIDFSTYPFYEGDDLGVFWSPEKTKIKIWAPTAKIVQLRLYKDGLSGEAYHKTNLQQAGDGTWSTVLKGDYEGKFYTFKINDGRLSNPKSRCAPSLALWPPFKAFWTGFFPRLRRADS